MSWRVLQGGIVSVCHLTRPFSCELTERKLSPSAAITLHYPSTSSLLKGELSVDYLSFLKISASWSRYPETKKNKYYTIWMYPL